MLSDRLPSNFGTTLLGRLDEIAGCSEQGSGVTRLPFTPQHRSANRHIEHWMTRAGLQVRLDGAGTLVGRRPDPDDGPTLLIGSHQDSIRHGGRYDGILGIALPVLVLETLSDASLPFSVEVLAFADEEGVRFPTALMGPRALAGTLDSACLNYTDYDGLSLGDALRAFGGNPDEIAQLRREAAGLLGYLEVHIEQGPVLEANGLPVGVVSGICGIERWRVVLTGESAHAGTTPMHLRRDALTGAAEVSLGLEALCRETENLVGVVGSLAISPNVVNAIPATAELTIELRALNDGDRNAAAVRMEEKVKRIAQARGLSHEIQKTYAQKAVACDSRLGNCLSDTIANLGLEPMALMSGATHDASAMYDLCPVAMLFVRCKRGISHHHGEAISAGDAQVAGAVVCRLLENWEV